jgi:hypothetical protein
VKKTNEDLEGYQDQLLDYSFKEGVKLAVLTNGISWWFYLPLHEGSWEQRKFYTIELYDQVAEDITSKFIDFLSIDKVFNGTAVENATKIITGKQKQSLIEETIPKAWDKLVTGHDEKLLELLADTTEKLCGYKPDYLTVEKFLTTCKIPTSYIKRPLAKSFKDKCIHPIGVPEKENYSNVQIMAFILNGVRYEVKSWREMLLKTIEVMVSIHRDQFDRVLNIVGRKRPYFTKNRNELRAPEKIQGTNIYVEINLSANSVVKIAKEMVTLLGYAESDLMFELKR